MKSIVDSSLITAAVSAFLYISGLSYYSVFFAILGIPTTEFLPPVPLVIAQAVIIFFQAAQNAIWYIFVVVVTALIARGVYARNKDLQRLLSRRNPVHMIRGWPLAAIALLLAGALVYWSGSRGLADADHQHSAVEAVKVTVHMKKELGGEPITGKFIAESSASYVIADNNREGRPVIIRKDGVVKVESHGPNLM